jgi:hypothetical protein
MIYASRNSRVSFDELFEAPIRRKPRYGAYWQPINHGDLISELIKQINDREWLLIESEYALSVDHADMAASLKLGLPGITAPEGTVLTMGVLNSNAQRRRLTIAIGATVLVCHNGLVTGKIVLQRKHTTGFSLERGLSDALDDYTLGVRQVQPLIQQLQQIPIELPKAEHLLMKAGRLGLLPWSRIVQVDQLFQKPEHPEFGNGTAWTLMNAFTQLVKQSPPARQIDEINGFRELLLEEEQMHQAA